MLSACDSPDRFEAPPERPEVPLQSNLVAQGLFAGMLWNRTGRGGEAPFQIQSSAGTNHILKLVDLSTGQDAIAILVRGGQTIDVQIPLGSYRMKWCSGTTWYGETDRFGPDESCSTTRDVFRFEQNGNYIEGHTVTLYAVSDGNMSTQSLDPSSF